MLATRIGRLRVFSVLEAISYIFLLLIASFGPFPWDAGVKVLGPVHGVLFIIYVLGALDLHKRIRWDNATLAKVLVASVIPFGTFFVERWLRTQTEPVRA